MAITKAQLSAVQALMAGSNRAEWNIALSTLSAHDRIVQSELSLNLQACNGLLTQSGFPTKDHARTCHTLATELLAVSELIQQVNAGRREDRYWDVQGWLSSEPELCKMLVWHSQLLLKYARLISEQGNFRSFSAVHPHAA